ncbi:MAG: hypothetical protein ACXQTR_03415 [Candidatus Methanospirareceae archaeon]
MRKPVEEMTIAQRLAQPFILKAIQQGYRKWTFYRELREKGLSYRMIEYSQDWDYWKRVLEESQRMRYTRRDVKISEERYVPNYWRKKGGYQTVFRVDIFDRRSQTEKRIYVTVAHEHYERGELVPDREQVYTRAELEAKVYQSIQYRVQRGEWEVRGITPVMGWKNLNVLK